MFNPIIIFFFKRIFPAIYLYFLLYYWPIQSTYHLCMGIAVFICLTVGIQDCLILWRIINHKMIYSTFTELITTVLLSFIVAVNPDNAPTPAQTSSYFAFSQITSALFHLIMMTNISCYFTIYALSLLAGIFSIV
jgi:hypothetical protein